MPEKKKRLPAAYAQTDIKQRFGAIAFSENIDGPENEDTCDETDGMFLSLDTLRAAFASVDARQAEAEKWFDGDDDHAIVEKEGDGTTRESTEENTPYGTPHFDTDTEILIEPSPKTIFEAMLFVGDRDNRPLSADRAAEKMRNVTVEEIEQIAAELETEYRKLGCPYMVVQNDAGYRMAIRPAFQPIQERFYGRIREASLSQQAIDTLAVVAYRQPVSAEDVQRIRKQPSSAILAQLARRGLVEIVDEGQSKKKTACYRTTERFLELFQLDSINDLPMPEDISFR